MLSEGMAEAAEREYPILDRIYEDRMVVRVSGRRVELGPVKLVRCRMEECNPSGTSFYDMMFNKCDLSDYSFRDTYWKNVSTSNSRGDGSQLYNSTLKWAKPLNNQFYYGSFSTVFWEFGEIGGRNFQESFMPGTKFKKTVFSSMDLTGVDSFHMLLKGMDLSKCAIGGIIVSGQLTKLSGIKVSPLQMAELARLMGVKIM